MPELPEVETIRRDLTREIVGHTIEKVQIIDPRVLRTPPQDFIRRLQGMRIKQVSRRGKALIIHLSSGEYLIAQVMMTGQLVVNQARAKHTRLAFKLSKAAELLYNDQRVFGQLRVVSSLDEVKYFRILGPEPFSAGFNDKYIQAYLKKTGRPIKSVLLDHTFVAGVGNIYAAEILFRCKIDPQRQATKIKPREAVCLQKKTREVLKQAINARGSSMRNYLDAAGKKGSFVRLMRVYAREGRPCLVCGHGIQRIAQGGRSTFYCMKCQK
jgi:formamidopyrimidine-DNA glycosylase